MKCYRQLSKTYHPDKFDVNNSTTLATTNDDANNLIQSINFCKDLLQDKKPIYDNSWRKGGTKKYKKQKRKSKKYRKSKKCRKSKKSRKSKKKN